MNRIAAIITRPSLPGHSGEPKETVDAVQRPLQTPNERPVRSTNWNPWAAYQSMI